MLTCADRAAAHWDRANAGARERAVAIRLRGFGHQLKKDYAAAITAYRESRELDRNRSAESVDVAIGLNVLADAEHRSGGFAAAEGHYREALRVARAVGYAEGVPIFTGNLADLALAREDWPAAETLAREALPHARRAVQMYTRLGSPDLAVAQETLEECERGMDGGNAERSGAPA